MWSGTWRLALGPPTAIIGVVIAVASDLAFVMVGGLAIAGVGLYLAWRGFAFLTPAIVPCGSRYPNTRVEILFSPIAL